MGGVLKLIEFIIVWVLLIGFSFGVGLFLVPLYYWLVFFGGTAREQKAMQKLQSTLIKEETVVAFGIQKRIFGLFTRRILVAISSSRLIEIRRSRLGGFDMKDYQWKDLLDAQMSENVIPNFFGAKITFVAKQNEKNISIDGLPSDIASSIYSYAQAQEHEWEEKNRVRNLEEKRAMSGSSVVTVGGQSGAPATSQVDMLDSLDKAKKLFDSGAINDVEYQELKAKIISKGV